MANSKFRTNKYKNEKQELDGYHFSSKLEASVYCLIKERIKAKEFKSVECQVTVRLSDAEIVYIPDFLCTKDDGSQVYIESKGWVSERWPTIKKLWKYYGLAPLEIFGGSYSAPKLLEIIIPRERK